MKRLVRFAFLASLVAAAVSAVRAMRREQDPLPAPPTGTGAGPWPPLQNPSPAPPKPEPAAEKPAPKNAAPKTTAAPKKAAPEKATPRKAAPKKAASPGPAPHDRDTPNGSVSPEPGGIPVGDRDTGPSAGRPWVEPTSEGECPDGYPIKAKLSSKIFHAPGQLNYDRTTPDRCYASTEAAEADGLRAAKR